MVPGQMLEASSAHHATNHVEGKLEELMDACAVLGERRSGSRFACK